MDTSVSSLIENYGRKDYKPYIIWRNLERNAIQRLDNVKRKLTQLWYWNIQKFKDKQKLQRDTV